MTKKHTKSASLKRGVIMVIISMLSLYSIEGFTSLRHGNLKFIIETAMYTGSADYLATVFGENVEFDTDDKSELVDQESFKKRITTFFETNKISSIELVSDNTFNISDRYLVWIYHTKNAETFKVSVSAKEDVKEDHLVCNRISIETVLR